MFKSLIITPALLFLAVSFTAPVFAEEDASMHQVYMAAESGKFKEAQSMMDKVLHDHPNSAKAHFVEAELLAKQGMLSAAAAELSTAERLQPGLPFAKPEALQNLKSRISSAAANEVKQPGAVSQNMPVNVKDWLPLILLILGVIGLIVLVIGFISRRNPKMNPGNAVGSNMSSVGPGGAGPVMGQPASGGMGSGIMGSLATGAALGAGVAAGEALVHHFIDGDKNDGDRNNGIPEPRAHETSSWDTAGNSSEADDMGGTDFGIEDNSSWDDDGASDGGDDWT